ncbi:hypothetical protein [Streptomyces avicenniae]|uniref:hypothetical protein n=1 Tax=Streptomyces avicenniae TaxID=500153 RepID=UPI00167DC19C|nr:hypothetical protein [Streptomyces avicenniae]
MSTAIPDEPPAGVDEPSAEPSEPVSAERRSVAELAAECARLNEVVQAHLRSLKEYGR